MGLLRVVEQFFLDICLDLKEGLQHWGPRGPNFFHWGPKWDLESIQSYTHDGNALTCHNEGENEKERAMGVESGGTEGTRPLQ